MPTKLPDGLVIGAITERKDCRDAIVLHPRHRHLLCSKDCDPDATGRDRRVEDSYTQSVTETVENIAVCVFETSSHVASGSGSGADSVLNSLPDGSVVGTSSLRRTATLKRYFPRLRFEVVRGNLNSRMKKLDAGGEWREKERERERERERMCECMRLRVSE